MKRLLTHNVCTMTELREPQKVFDRAGGEPVAIMKNSRCVGYLVPEEWVEKHGITSEEELNLVLVSRKVED